MNYTSREVYEFIAKQSSDPIIEWKICAVSWAQFPLYQSDIEFYQKISPTFAGQKFPITPLLCPEERNRRRLAFRNERKLYRRTCDASKQPIISVYSPDKPYKVYDAKIWRSDSWSALDYGRDFDFNKSFTENFEQLILQVPRLPLYGTNNESSDYVNGAAYNKNCYLIFASDYDEDCMFADNSSYCSHSLDLSDTTKSQYSYQLISCDSCSSCTYSIDCRNCDSCSYCFDCRQCTHCFLCSSLSDKQYCFQNIQYSPEEYQQLIKQYNDTHTQAQTMSDFINIKKQSIHSFYSGFGNQNTSGNVITNCNNSQNMFSCHEMQNCKNIINWTSCNDCYDSYVIIDNSQLCYQNLSSIWLYQCMSTVCCWNTNQHIYYCDHCQNCQNCFGCIWLRDKSYCIFNKQYTKQEYKIQVAKIIKHMISTGERGEFFHPSISPFGYNETVAQDYYPITREQASEQWLPRSTYSSDPSIPTWAQVINKSDYSDTHRDELKNDPDTINKIFICETSGRPYKLQKTEIEFYQKHHLPLPTKHSDIRHEERMSLRPKRTLFLRNCDQCDKQILSVYTQEYKGKVYCESCYQKEIIG